MFKIDKFIEGLFAFYILGLILVVFMVITIGIKSMFCPNPLEMYEHAITTCTDDNCRVAVNRFYKYLYSEVNNDDR